MRLLLLVALLLAACAPSAPPEPSAAPPPSAEAPLPEPPPETDDERAVEGAVTAVDFDPMSYDGDGIVTLRTDAGAEVVVRLPARYGLCDAAFDDWAGLAVGDRIAVRGAVEAEGAVRPCASAAHYFRRR